MTDWYDDDRLTYRDADELVARYIDHVGQTRTQTTSVEVLRWGDAENSHHNRARVYDALCDACHSTDENWAGRTVFELPTEDQ